MVLTVPDIECDGFRDCPVPLFCSAPHNGMKKCYDRSTDLNDGESCDPDATWEEAQCSRSDGSLHHSACLRNGTGHHVCMRAMNLLEMCVPEYEIGCGDFRLKCDSTKEISLPRSISWVRNSGRKSVHISEDSRKVFMRRYGWSNADAQTMILMRSHMFQWLLYR